jgi:hypothetical protein
MSGRKPTAAPGICECHGKPSAECPRNRLHKVTAKEQHEATLRYFSDTQRNVTLGLEWLMCRCGQGAQPAHQAHPL